MKISDTKAGGWTDSHREWKKFRQPKKNLLKNKTACFLLFFRLHYDVAWGYESLLKWANGWVHTSSESFILRWAEFLAREYLRGLDAHMYPRVRGEEAAGGVYDVAGGYEALLKWANGRVHTPQGWSLILGLDFLAREYLRGLDVHTYNLVGGEEAAGGISTEETKLQTP